MAYTCVINPSNKQFIFSKFYKTVFKTDEDIIKPSYTICLKTSTKFSMALFRNTTKSSKVDVKTVGKSLCVKSLYYATNVLSYASITMIWFIFLAYITMFLL